MAVLNEQQSINWAKSASAAPQRGAMDSIIGGLGADAFGRLGSAIGGAFRGDAGKYLSKKDKELYKDPTNAIKDVASLASYLAPGAGIKGLALAGGLSGFGGSVGKDAGATAINTLTGAATGVGLGLAGKGINAVAGKLANKNAQKAVQTASKEFNIDELYNQLGKPAKGAEGIFTNWQTKTLGVKGTKNIIDKPQVLVDNQRILNSLGFENSEKGIQKGISKLAEGRNGAVEAFQRANPKVGLTNDALISPLEGRLDDIVLASDKKISKEALRGSLNKYLQQSKFGTVIDKQGGLKNLALPDLQQISSSLKSELRNATPRMKESAALQAKQALVEQIDTTLEKLVPETTKYNRVMASLYNSQEATGRKALNAANMNTSGGLGKGGFFGLGDVLPVQEGINKAYELAGRAGNSVVNKGAQVAENAAIKSVPKSTAAGDLLQNPKLASILAPFMQGVGQVQPAFAATPESNPEGLASQGQTLESNDGQAIVAQLLASGMKPSDIKTLQDIGAIPKTSLDKPASAAERKTNAQAKYALRSIDNIEGALQKDPSSLQKAILPEFMQDETTRSLNNNINAAAEAYGRVQSGGAINKDEEVRFKQQVYSIFASSASQQEKLNILRQYFTDVLG